MAIMESTAPGMTAVGLGGSDGGVRTRDESLGGEKLPLRMAALTPVLQHGYTELGVARHRVELRIVNGFEVRHDERPVELPLTAQRLVAFLAFQKRAVQRVYVAGKLWTNTAEDRASGSLRSAIWRVKQTDVPLIQTVDTRLALDPDVHVDLAAAEVLARHLVAGSGDARMADLAVLCGEILPDWYDDWLLMEREVHRQLRLHALEALALRLAATACYSEAIDAALSAIAGEPLRDSAHRTLVRVYLAEGNVSEAVRHVGLYRERLAPIGIAPSAEFEELVSGLTSR
jgi:DNA-binding SARP family transcriptional activator